MIVRQRIVVQSCHDRKLVGILHETGSKEVVIVCHGFKSSKDGILTVNLASGLEKIGVSAFRFDFPGNGESEGPLGFGNLQREIEHLRAVIQHFRGIGRIVTTIVGHSKGGITVLLYASKYSDVRRVVNISGSSDLMRTFEAQLGKVFFERMERDGFVDVNNRRGEFQYRLTYESIKEDLLTDIRAACQLIHEHCRVLTVHGTNDRLVPVEDALEFDKLIANHVLRFVEGADHDYILHQNELASIVVDFVRDVCTDNSTMNVLPSSTGDASARPRL